MRQNNRIVRSKSVWVLGILGAALLLRLWGIKGDLPFHFYPDEDYLIYHSLKFGTGDLNPHWFVWPQFFEYTLFFFFGVYFFMGKLAGIFADAHAFLYAYLKNPTTIYLMARSFTALAGVGTVYFFYKCVRELFSSRVALLGACILAVSPLHIKYSQLAVTDVPMLFLIMVAWYFFIPLFKGDTSVKPLLLGSFFLGLATATKYPAAFFASSVATLLLVYSLQGKISKKKGIQAMGLMGVAMVGGFFFASPFCLIDFKTFWEDLVLTQLSTRLGWRGWEQVNAFLFHFTRTLPHAMGWPLFVCAVLGLISQRTFSQPKRTAIFTFLVVWFVIFGRSRTFYDRFMLPAVPFLALFAALFLERCYGYIRGEKKKIIAGISVGVFLIFPLSAATLSVHNQTLLNTQLLAQAWIQDNIPQGSNIVLAPEVTVLEQNPARILAAARKKGEPQYDYQKERGVFYEMKARKASEGVWYNLFPIMYPIAYLKDDTYVNERIEETLQIFDNLQEYEYAVITGVHQQKFFSDALPEKFLPYRHFYESLQKKKALKVFEPRAGKTKGLTVFIYKLGEKRRR